MFDLNQAIAEWRRQMFAAGIKSAAVLDELESHLREVIEQQVQSGAGAQQAVTTAVQRIGLAHEIRAEFAKNPGTNEARQRKIAGRLFAVFLGLYSVLGISALLRGPELNLAERLLGIAGLGATAFLAYVGWRFMPRIFPVISNKVLRSGFQLTCGISGVAWVLIFAWFILPRLEFTQGQLAVAIIWGFLPALVLPTTLVGFDKVEGRVAAMGHS